MLEEQLTIRVGETILDAELADEPVEIDRGWRKRRCDLEALVLQPSEPGPLPVWGCELTRPLDVAFVGDATVLDVRRLEPCSAPCGGCPTIGDELTVDFVLEVPADTIPLEVGMSVRTL